MKNYFWILSILASLIFFTIVKEYFINNVIGMIFLSLIPLCLAFKSITNKDKLGLKVTINIGSGIFSLLIIGFAYVLIFTYEPLIFSGDCINC